MTKYVVARMADGKAFDWLHSLSEIRHMVCADIRDAQQFESLAEANDAADTASDQNPSEEYRVVARPEVPYPSDMLRE